MKVLVVGTGGSIVSGISTAADEMARTLVRYGHTVERLNAGDHMRRRGGALNLENVRAAAADALAIFRRTRRTRPDAVWIHTFGMPTLAAGRALVMVTAARLARRPAVVHFHAYGLEQTIATGGRPLRAVLRLLTTVANATVVLYPAAADALRSVGRRRGHPRIHVLRNWVEAPAETAPVATTPELRAVFVGGLVRRKGVPQLIEAMRTLTGDDGAPVHLTLVGGAGEDGPEALDRLKADATDLVAAGRLGFAGERDEAGVRAELRNADLFVLPSDAEGTPIAMLEAMSEGRPVLVTDAGDMRAVVEESSCGWVLPDRDPATIAAFLRRLTGSPAELAAASKRARQAVAAHYSAQARRADIEAVLASLG